MRPVVVASRREQPLPVLPPDVEAVYDAVENAGPLAGMAAGFEALAGRCEAAFVVSCDHPLLKPAFIARLIELLGDHQAVVPSPEARSYPLVAVYRIDRCPLLAELLDTASGACTPSPSAVAHMSSHRPTCLTSIRRWTRCGT